MTDDIRRFAFLLRQLPICTQSPIKTLLGPDLHRELRAKYKLELDLDLLDDRCPNSFNCLMEDSGCIGRPFPIDEDVLAALGKLNVQVSKGLFKGREVYLAEATVTCSGCPFAGQCETSCATQDSFLNRSTKPESNPPENALVPYEDFERGMYKALTPEAVEHCQYGEWIEQTLPLDCLTPKQRQVIEMTLYEGLDQVVIANRLKVGVPRVNLHLSRAKARLEEFGKARKAISISSKAPQEVIDYYIGNLNHQQIANKYNKDRSTITKALSRWYKSIP